MQAVLDNQTIMDKKNVLLQPIFRDIKSQIRHMTHTPEYQLMSEYITRRNELSESTRNLPADQQQAVLNELKASYAGLVKLRQQKMNESVSLRLQTLQKRLEDIFELLNAWQQYVDIIYMSDADSLIVEALY